MAYSWLLALALGVVECFCKYGRKGGRSANCCMLSAGRCCCCLSLVSYRFLRVIAVAVTVAVVVLLCWFIVATFWTEPFINFREAPHIETDQMKHTGT
jgi:hypothetical protein